MSVEYFLDTNILLYRYSDQDVDKCRIAANLLESGRAIASAQVLNEFCNVTRKKFPASYAKIESALTDIQRLLPIMPLDFIDTLSAVRIEAGLMVGVAEATSSAVPKPTRRDCS